MTGCGCEPDVAATLQRRTLVTLLAINGAMFFVEAVAGWWGDSAGLLADSLDMLADASVYGIALLAVGRPVSAKIRAAMLNGILQLVLGLLVCADVLRRYLSGSDPESPVIIGIGTLALLANIACLIILSRHRHDGVHMRASWICSRSDVIANLGVLAAGGLVAITGSRLPDLIIGGIIAVVVLQGAAQILREARLSRAPQSVGHGACHDDGTEARCCDRDDG